ncbi:MAG: glutamate-5-semialdehyde dehydrogenase [Planctomycetota bacterium]
MEPIAVADAARAAAAVVASATTTTKNAALARMAELLDERRADIVAANAADRAAAEERGIEQNLLDRLSFDGARIDSRIASLETIVGLPDPVGSATAAWRCANGMDAARVRVPLGVILMVFEARPHVTVNAGAFCLKAGNACILRGGFEARRCNALLGELWATALAAAGLPREAIQVVSGTHAEVGELLQFDSHIDLVIPRGGPGLIRAVAEQSRIPVIKHFNGVCHVYLDSGIDLDRGLDIALDGKCLMPQVCNATESVLVHRDHAPQLPRIVAAFRDNGVTVRGCPAVCAAVGDVEAASEEDWSTEYLDLTVSLRVVDDVDAAADHINTYGSHHTDSIVTDSEPRARRFTQVVDSSVVLTNASTMYCDGASLGMGAEIGISTDRLHARGPMGLADLTTTKYVIRGDHHVMGPARCTGEGA